VTISPKFQVVIPKTIRERLRLSPGQKVQALLYGNRIELIDGTTASHHPMPGPLGSLSIVLARAKNLRASALPPGLYRSASY
jgi:AbrB family looped-hinge helix DNA binding protein